THPPDVVLAPDAAARLAWDWPGSKRETSLARHSFHLPETSSTMSGPAHPSRSGRGQAPCQQLPVNRGRTGRPSEQCELKPPATVRHDFSLMWIASGPTIHSGPVGKRCVSRIYPHLIIRVSRSLEPERPTSCLASSVSNPNQSEPANRCHSPG